ncbi:MAG: polyphosphate kinase 2 [Saprospiraceae bacterium]|nr:polyphosphate kinase 2 [Saprospiraceae bacterium]
MDQYAIEEHYQVNAKHIEELYLLQVELLKLQKHISEDGRRVAIIFEGRDTAGKGSAIFRFTQFLNPREYRIVALGKPSQVQAGQWYFQRYIKELPNPGEIVLFDRSWYNRAVVEPAMGFCSDDQYQLFMNQVLQLEKMLIDDGIHLIKFWFSIKADEQAARIKQRLVSPLKRWKVSPVDVAAQEKWAAFTQYKKAMFERTHTEQSPWVLISSNDRENSRIQAMRYVLSLYNYADKSVQILPPDDRYLYPFKLA